MVKSSSGWPTRSPNAGVGWAKNPQPADSQPDHTGLHHPVNSCVHFPGVRAFHRPLRQQRDNRFHDEGRCPRHISLASRCQQRWHIRQEALVLQLSARFCSNCTRETWCPPGWPAPSAKKWIVAEHYFALGGLRLGARLSRPFARKAVVQQPAATAMTTYLPLPLWARKATTVGSPADGDERARVAAHMGLDWTHMAPLSSNTPQVSVSAVSILPVLGEG